MADPKAIRAGGAYIELFAETGPLARGLKKATGVVKAWAGGLKSAGINMAALGGAGVAGFLATAKAAADAGGDLDDMAERTGLAVEALSGLKYAAEQSGTSLEGIEAGVKKLGVNLADAASGSESARKKFDDIGVSWSDLASMTPDQQFIAVADALSGIDNPGRKAAATMDLLGKSGVDLLPLMNSGASGIRGLIAEAEKLGLVMSGEDAKAAAEFGDKLDKVFSLARMSVVRLGAAVLPVLEPIVVMVAKAASAVGKWIAENKALVSLAFAGAAGLTLFGLGLSAVGTIIGGLVTVGGFAVSAFLAIGSAVALLAPLFTGWGLALATVAGFLAGTVNWSNVTRSAVEWLGAGFAVLKDETVKALGAMGAALTSGNIQGAVAVLWSFLEVQWLKGKIVLLTAWDSMTSGIVEGWRNAVRYIAGAGIGTWGAIQKAWVVAADFISDATTILTSSFQMLWLRAFAFIEKKLVWVYSLFDKTIDVNVRVNKIENDMALANNAILDRANSRLGRGQNPRLAQIDQETKDALDSLTGPGSTGENSRIKQANKDLAEAREKFEAAAVAANEAGTKTGDAVAALTKPKETALSELQSSSVIGSFSPFGLDGVGGMAGLGQQIITEIKGVKSEVAGLRTDERERPKL